MSTWYPIGPAHVFLPILPIYDRILRENENGLQGTVASIAIDPNNRDNILVVDRPDSGGSGLWRSQDGGVTWTSVLESINARVGPGYGPGTDPTCVVFHPNLRDYVYLGSGRRRTLYGSSNGGVDWDVLHEFGGAIQSIIVDPRTGAPPETVDSTALFVNVYDATAPANTVGVWHSAHNGDSPTRVLAGPVESFAPSFSDAGSDAYAFAYANGGLFFSPEPHVGSWQSRSYGGPLAPGEVGAFPAPSPFEYDVVRIARSPTPDGSVWVWTALAEDSMGLYRSTDTGMWERVAIIGDLPGPCQTPRNFVFVVAPQTQPGQADTLFFGGCDLYRSTDQGATWHSTPAPHPDVWTIEFRSPDPTSPGLPPELWVGTDGGIAYSATDPPGVWREMNRGKYGSAAYQMAVPVAARTLTYIGCQDTGIAVGGGSLTWRGASNADSGAIAADPGPTGMQVWSAGGYNDFPRPAIELDVGVDSAGSLSGTPVRTAPGGFIAPTSNFVLDGNGRCLVGGICTDETRTVDTTTSSPPPGEGWIYLGNILGIQAGQWLTVDPSQPTDAKRVVDRIATTGDEGWIQLADFTLAPAPGTVVALNDAFVFSADAVGNAIPISQSFAEGQHVVRSIAFDPRGTVAFAGTRRAFYLGGSMNPADNPPLHRLPDDAEFDRPRVFKTTAGAAAPSMWPLVDGNRPTAPGKVSSIAVTPGGIGYVMLDQPLEGTAADGSTIVTPLFRIDGMQWTALPCGLQGIRPGFNFGKIVLDPISQDVIYAAYGPWVYALAPDADGVWQFGTFDYGGKLPGDLVVDLWVGNVGTAQRPRILLRACLGARGVWEIDMTPGQPLPNPFFYMRNNVLDDAWVLPSLAGVPNPLVPTERVWWWQSPDIRVETVQGSPGNEFFQTDPEWAGPGSGTRLPHAMFNMLSDYSLNLVADSTARIHVQVHNRARQPASTRVVVLATSGAAGVPNLDLKTDGTTFDFWGLFLPSGEIDLDHWPPDAIWQPIGIAPDLIDEVTDVAADAPQVVTREWPVPPLAPPPPEDPNQDPPEAHRCLVAIAHGPDHVLPPTTHVDWITPSFPWFAQKNLHIVRMLPARGIRLDIEGAPIEWSASSFAVEFHNSEESERIAALVFDVRNLPRGIRVHVEMVDGARPRNVSGARPAHPSKPAKGKGLDGLLARVVDLLRRPAKKSRSWFGHGGKQIVLEGVRLPPLGSAKALLRLAGDGSLVEGSEARFDIVQRVKNEVVGGSTYVVRVGEPTAKPSELAPSDPDEATQMSRLVPLILAAPWMEDVVESRLRETGRYPTDRA
jgi:hypothetical protein